MQVNMDTIKTTAFVLKNRLLGYKLLQNQKGTNPNEVTMIKSKFGVADDYSDKIYNTIRIHRKKLGDKFVKEKKEIYAKYLMDPETFAYSGKNKNVMYFYDIDRVHKFKEKEAIPFENNDKRPYPKWLTKEVQYEFEGELFEENREKEKNGGYYLPRPGLVARIISLGMWREILGYDSSTRPVEPGFWHVLRTNLNGGGIHTEEREPHVFFAKMLK